MVDYKVQEQPLPEGNDNPRIHDLVSADIQKRKEVGIQRYGQALQADNGRNALTDAYEEVLDFAVYLRQEIEERYILFRTIAGLFEGAGFKMPERMYTDSASFLRDIKHVVRVAEQYKERFEILQHERDGEVWIWQGIPGEDNIESLTCPVLIQPRDLERMYWAEFFMEGKPGETPLPMLLWCPVCHEQHIDAPEPACPFFIPFNDAETKIAGAFCVKAEGHQGDHSQAEEDMRWMNPPHKTHKCHNCGTKWRPCVLNTTGIAFVKPGENDTWPPKVER